MSGSSQNHFSMRRRSRSYVLSCQSDAMQFDLSGITFEIPLSRRQAAAARPEGPAPTVNGPGTWTRIFRQLARVVHLVDEMGVVQLLPFYFPKPVHRSAVASNPSWTMVHQTCNRLPTHDRNILSCGRIAAMALGNPPKWDESVIRRGAGNNDKIPLEAEKLRMDDECDNFFKKFSWQTVAVTDTVNLVRTDE